MVYGGRVSSEPTRIGSTLSFSSQARLAVQAALDAKSSELVAEIRRMVVDRPFLLNASSTKSSINGIHFVYAWDSFQTVACPLNTSTGYCGRGALLRLTRDPNEPLVNGLALSLGQPSDEGAQQDELGALLTEVFCCWFSAAWQLARTIDPSIRGFLSVHDTIWRTDLDTGEEFREDSGRVKFF